MLRFPLFALAVGLTMAPAAPAQTAPARNGLNKAWMEIYARHLWALPSEFEVTVADPKPSPDLPGFKEVVIHLAQGKASQDAKLLVSDDGTRIVEGTVYDAGANAFKKNLDKLNTQGAASEGPAGAPVTIVEFTDFECPYCKLQAQILRENLKTKYPTQVRFYFKEFPLESIHEWAKAAAVNGRCVLRQSPEVFWEYHDWVYAHQDGFTAKNLKEQVMAWAQGRKDLDSLQLGRCIDEQATAKEVEATMEQGKALGVDGTPTLFINGRHVAAGVTEWEGLKRYIDSELEYLAKVGGAAAAKPAAAKPPAPPPPVPPAKKK
jgi:protein-disulfide isomerase